MIQSTGTNSAFLLSTTPTSSQISLSLFDSTFERLDTPQSKEGGGMKVGMGEEGKMRMSGCVMKDCKCSLVVDGSGKPTSGSGRGGGIYLNTDITKEYEIDLLIEKTSFITNNATLGRDIYIKCANTASKSMKHCSK
jgi:hypothetical protein